MHVKSYFYFAFITLLIFSCKKENKDSTIGPDEVNNLPVIDYEMFHITKPEWLIYKVDASGVDVWKVPGIIESCKKDDTYRFYKDSMLTTFENSNICAGSPDSVQSAWNFIDGRKKITAALLGTTDTADIILLTDSTMQLFLNYMGTDATVFFKKK